MFNETCETVMLPCGKKVLEIKTIDFKGQARYTYSRRGFPFDTSKYEKDSLGAIIDRKYDFD